MSKSKEELNALKGRYEDVVNEIRELTPEELEQVTGGCEKIQNFIDMKKILATTQFVIHDKTPDYNFALYENELQKEF